MVGIPRSKGCKTCRRKKIKCDEQKPGCGQCRRGVRECEGYDQPTIFRHSSAADFVDTSCSQRPETTHFKSPPVKNVTWISGQVNAPLCNRETEARPGPACRDGTSPSRTWFPGLGCAESITGQFLEVWRSAFGNPRGAIGLARRNSGNRARHRCVAAGHVWSLALGWAGQVNSQPRLAGTGLQLYNAAIRQLRTDMTTCSPLQSLIVTTIFVTFELCQFGSKGNPGWLTHMKGIAAFLQALGPEKVSTDPYLKIFSFCRVVFIMQGLNRRRSVCAGSQMWKHGPFRNHTKSAYDQFYDLSANACELLGFVDALEKPNDGILANDVEAKQPAQVLREILDLISRLKKWMQGSNIVGFNAPLRFPSNDSAIHHRLDRARARGYPTKLPSDRSWTSETLSQQRMIYNYWTLCLELYMTVVDSSVLNPLLNNSDEFQGLLTTELKTGSSNAERAPTSLIFEECRKLASNIALNCASVCDSVHQNFGSLVTIYTLETALRWYERHSRDASQVDVELEQHCRAVLDGIRIEESKDPCPFEVSVLTDEVLRRNWC
ncbi:hypothetical protein NUW58_g1084 [Xylaria curta]|uniref:Uncharacterized protein n=1 Tax=Xylaria curta TaxID=42375 RepID=A0ACC1PLS9_9PEZI|nr:hypothetical protein NUW58_g1084 [Xylaria curta]